MMDKQRIKELAKQARQIGEYVNYGQIRLSPEQFEQRFANLLRKDFNKIYAAQYNPCTDEHDFGIISLHKTKEGAEKAINQHKSVTVPWWTSVGYTHLPDWVAWQIQEMEVLE